MQGQQFSDSGRRFISHTFSVPLDYQAPEGEKITVFAREITTGSEQKPWLVYFQGGPGFQSPRPNNDLAWVDKALERYRVLLLDQRGTGHSTPINHQTLAGLRAEQQAEYLSLFRADNIIRDAEEIRKQIGIDQWAILGQSFGGFCSLTYLSMFPESLLRSYITGGIPSISAHPDVVYEATFKRTRDKNKAFFEQFPQAQAQCQKIANHLLNNEEFLPNGQRFTVEQFQQLGINFGMSNTFLAIYYLLESAFIEVNGKEVLNYTFLNEMLAQQSFQTNPLYALLHEPCYCQNFASDWSAHRVRQQNPEFNYQQGNEFLFTGEMVFPFMFEQYNNLQPLKDAAEILAKKSDWEPLYNAEVLSNNKVPVTCAVYADDMFVEMDLSRETLSKIPNSRAWITNEYEHNGIRADGGRVLGKLFEMSDAIAENIANKKHIKLN
ncbi:proline iminopeptidase [Vibrio ishigakensis]|uniref:Proline iminopeptidase n=2 Tax=Vibrio ishigakensis TaxID=1481914 RepID=A0A0B8NSL6_9VIBR|nr:alpha/beta hydrolase [Vibrio ishigakensis]GAM54148.1 proline iminopeptidase [Vibrio ishigakensis]